VAGSNPAGRTMSILETSADFAPVSYTAETRKTQRERGIAARSVLLEGPLTLPSPPGGGRGASDWALDAVRRRRDKYSLRLSCLCGALPSPCTPATRWKSFDGCFMPRRRCWWL